MKASFLIVITSALALAFCKEPITETIEYRIIVNRSSHDVVIEVVGKDINLNYDITSSDSIVIQGKCFVQPGTDYCNIGWHDNSSLTAKVVFDNKRQQFFSSTSCGSGKNILSRIAGDFHLCGYINRNVNGRSEYVYTITEEDYQNAEVIGGG